MTDLDERLAARFAAQDDAALQRAPAFELVRSRAAQLERRRTRRRLTLLLAVLLAALAAVPAIALSRTLLDHFFGQPADLALRDYIGRVLHLRGANAFATPPRYVAGVQTSRGLVLLWAGRRSDGTECTGLEAAFGDAGVKRLEGGAIADNGITCGSRPSPVGPQDAGLDHGQGLGGVHVEYGHLPASVRSLRVSFEDGRTQTIEPSHGWAIVAFEGAASRPGHRPILEQALGAHGRTLASERLDPWNYGGKEPPAPGLDDRGSRLLTTIRAGSGRVQLRLSAPGLGWKRQQCWGLVAAQGTTSLECAYPAALDARIPPPSTNNLFLFGPRSFGVVIGMATRIDHAWLVSAAGRVQAGRIVRLTLAASPRTLIVAPARRGPNALSGVVTSRNGRIVGAVLTAKPANGVSFAARAPCFLAAPSAGARPTTAPCRAVMAAVRRSTGLHA